MKNRKSCAAVTIVGALLVIVVVTVVVSSVLFIGMPNIADLESDGNFQNLEILCGAIVDNINEITFNKPGEQKIIPFTVDKGSISVDKNEYDKTIVSYSNESDEKYNFTVTGLDDDDRRFRVLFATGWNNGLINAHIHWIDGESAGKREDSPVTSEGYVDASVELKGTVEILINDTEIASDFLVGKIWLFDSNFLTCDLTSGETPHIISIEKGGIVYYNSQQSRVEKSFNLDAENDYLKMQIVNLKALKSFSIFDINVQAKISTNSIINKVQEMKRLYFIKIQFHRHNAQTWINYIDSQYDEFVPVNSNMLFYAPSDSSIYPGGVLTVFSHSLVEIDTN